MLTEKKEPNRLQLFCFLVDTRALHVPFLQNSDLQYSFFQREIVFFPVLRIRIHMFLDLPDPHPDPLVTSTDPALDPSSSRKNSKKNRDFYCFTSVLDLAA
jgi:hypothetical protein